VAFVFVEITESVCEFNMLNVLVPLIVTVKFPLRGPIPIFYTLFAQLLLS